MAVLFQSKAATGGTPIPYPSYAGHVVALRVPYTVPTSVAAGDIIEFGSIPAGCRLIDAIVDADDLDSGTAALTLDVGIMSGEVGLNDNTRTCGAEILSASTVGQAGGIVRPTAKGAARIASSNVARSVGLKIGTVADTAVAGVVGITLIYATE